MSIRLPQEGYSVRERERETVVMRYGSDITLIPTKLVRARLIFKRLRLRLHFQFDVASAFFFLVHQTVSK